MRVLALTLLLALAGCTQPTEAPPTFDEAMASAGEEFAAGDVTIKILEPHPLEEAPMGEQEIVLVAHRNGTPATDLSFQMEAEMPAMGHGCECDEEAPQHVGEGVYIGRTNLFMNGDWTVTLRVQGADLDEGVLVDVRV